MKTLFIEGGALFMGMLSIVFLVVLAIAVRSIIGITKSKKDNLILQGQIGYLKSLGLFALVLGMLGQFIGLFTAFEYIAQKGAIAPGILAAGFKVSSIPSIYGMIILLVAYLLWFGLDSMSKKKAL